ncbi:hypothetical protein SAMN05216284_105166 [Micromonospora sediminimaris]|nr:hypothetical protein SAMN05216284_105166 [Micromonospora sediminimaris]
MFMSQWLTRVVMARAGRKDASDRVHPVGFTASVHEGGYRGSG